MKKFLKDNWLISIIKLAYILFFAIWVGVAFFDINDHWTGLNNIGVFLLNTHWFIFLSIVTFFIIGIVGWTTEGKSAKDIFLMSLKFTGWLVLFILTMRLFGTTAFWIWVIALFVRLWILDKEDPALV